MTSLDKFIHDLLVESDVNVNGDVYQEILLGLSGIGLEIAFFVFKSATNSHYARRLEDGCAVSCPYLTIYLKYDEDFVRTGISPHQGNWDDKWHRTVAAREVVNTVLRRHCFGSEFVSDRTFVFVDTRERIAFLQIGKECKTAVRNLVCGQAPGVTISQIFWLGNAQYHVIMQDKDDFKRVNGAVKATVNKALPKILAAADVNGYCQRYDATIEFGHSAMNLFHLIREDV